MDLRQLKKEAHALPNLSEHLAKFQQFWIKPIKTNTNKELPFLQNLSATQKQEINSKIDLLKKKIKEVEQAQVVNQKLQEYARYLIELKLTTLNGNHSKGKYITQLLLQDQFLNTTQIIDDIKLLEKNFKSITYKYHHINELIHKGASLDEAVHFMHLPHQEHLQMFLQASRKQKNLVKHLGNQFIGLVKEVKANERRHK